MAKKGAKKKASDDDQKTLELNGEQDADDRRLYHECELAILRGDKPTFDQSRARRRYLKNEGERIADRYLRELPVRDFAKLLGSGLHTTTVADLSRNLNLDGLSLESVDLTAWLRSLFPLLRENWAALCNDEHKKAEAEMRTAKLKLEAEKMAFQVEEFRAKRDELAGGRIEREDVAAFLDLLAAKMKKATERIARRNNVSGREVQRTINAVLDTIENEFAE